MNKAKGEYITFVDADDYLYQDYYERINRDIKGEDLVFSHYVIEDNGKKVQIYNKNLKRLEINPSDLMILYRKSDGIFEEGKRFIDESVSVFVWRVWFRIGFLNSYGIFFNELLRYGEDRIFLQESLVHAITVKVIDDNYGYVHTIQEGRGNLTELKTIRTYIPWLYQQQKSMDYAEQEVCKKCKDLSIKELNTVRLQRENAMRSLIIINEFKYNKSHAIKNINAYMKDDFFRWSYNWINFVYVVESGNIKEVIKFLLVKYRCYKLLEMIYEKEN